MMRSGFSQRVGGASNALRMGTVIKLGIEGGSDVSMMVSAIVTKDDGSGADALFALLTAHSRIYGYVVDARCSLIRGPGQPRIPLGTLVRPETVLGPRADQLGFHILKLEGTPLFGAATSSAKHLATTRNFRKGIWGAGTFKVRRLNDVKPSLETISLKQKRPYLSNKMGRVAGDIDHVEIYDVGRSLYYSYCGLVTRGRNRPLGDPHSLGAPLLSKSGALSAIIVGAAETDTLVFPIEELTKDVMLDFVTLGGDWPKVRTKARPPVREAAETRDIAAQRAIPAIALTPRLAFQSGDMAIDLGAANTVVYVRGRGIVLKEPSLVAVETINGVKRVKAIGDDAKLMMGKTAGTIKAVRPLRDGAIAEVDLTEQMIKHFIQKVRNQRRVMRLPEIVISVPSGSTKVERRAIRDAAQNAGASQVWLIEEPMAAAIGADVPFTKPVGSMVVDIGGSTTKVAVLSLRGLAYTTSVRGGGDKMDEAIVSYVRRNHNLLIGEATAERIKQDFGMAKMPADGVGETVHIRGRDLLNGVPKEIQINQGQIAAALSEPLATIVEGVRIALENTSPDLAADIVEQGIVLTGGGALLQGIDEVLSDETGLTVTIAIDPLTVVVSGAASAMDMPDNATVLSTT